MSQYSSLEEGYLPYSQLGAFKCIKNKAVGLKGVTSEIHMPNDILSVSGLRGIDFSLFQR